MPPKSGHSFARRRIALAHALRPPYLRARAATLSGVPDDAQTSESVELAIEEVDELLAEGREQGYLLAEHVHDVLAEVELTPDQIDAIFVLFRDLGIEIIES